jgi:hypothetical protein
MLQPQNPWETGELAGLMGLAKDDGEVVSTWSVGVGFDHQMAPVLRGKVPFYPHLLRHTQHGTTRTHAHDTHTHTSRVLRTSAHARTHVRWSHGATGRR